MQRRQPLAIASNATNVPTGSFRRHVTHEYVWNNIPDSADQSASLGRPWSTHAAQPGLADHAGRVVEISLDPSRPGVAGSRGRGKARQSRRSVIVPEGEVGTADRAGQLRLLARELEPGG